MRPSDIDVIWFDGEDGEKGVDKALPRRSMPAGCECHTNEELGDGDCGDSHVVAIVDDVMKRLRSVLSSDQDRGVEDQPCQGRCSTTRAARTARRSAAH